MDIVQVNDNRILKALRYIKMKFGYDSHESAQLGPFGDDSCPIKGVKGIKSETSNDSVHVILGYFNRDPKSLEGEKRLYSVKPDESEGFYIYFKNDGTCEIGGNIDNLVRFTPLKTAFDRLVGDHNGLVDKFNTHTHTETGAATSVPLITAVESTADISESKIEQIKTL